MTKKALIAMSGGVDSTAAAYLTKQAGYDCEGVTLKLYHGEQVGQKTVYRYSESVKLTVK